MKKDKLAAEKIGLIGLFFLIGFILLQYPSSMSIIWRSRLKIAALMQAWTDETTSSESSVNSQTENCSPSYPGVCIAPAPPDLDCKDVPYRRFQVLSPDPHRFDGDKDGIGCEKP